MFGRIAALIESSKTVAVSGHTDPDGDALGSVLALTHVIEERWPDVRVQPLLANDRPLDSMYAFMPGVERFVPACRYTEVPDLFIAVDTPTVDRLRDSAAVLKRAGKTALFDHHPTMDEYAQVCYLRAEASAVGDVIYDFARFVGAAITPQVATCILTAVMTDTGRFQYQNTDARALRTAADMVEAGASPATIANSVYQSMKLSTLKLNEVVLSRLALTDNDRIAYSYVTKEDLDRCGVKATDCDGLIDVVRSLAGAKACLFMRELPDGSVRGNLRSKVDWIDVSAVAAQFGGGGHRVAAGFSAPAPLAASLEKSLRMLAERIDADCALREEGRA